MEKHAWPALRGKDLLTGQHTSSVAATGSSYGRGYHPAKKLLELQKLQFDRNQNQKKLTLLVTGSMLLTCLRQR